MKRIAILFMAVVLVAASTSFAFAECAGHTKAQLVKSDQSAPQQQVSQEPSTATPITVAEKVAEPVQPVAQASEKK